MAWPLSHEYNEAVQNPRTVFDDPDLKAGEVVPGPLGIPMPRSGNFADVYQVRGADGRMWALKCFTRPASGLRERYLKIDAHLRQARLPFSVGFEFLPEGMRIRGLWFPALKMEWVEGLQLNEFVRKNADKPEHLKALLGLWVRLCKRLRDAKIAHADLQHGNVLLVPGATANTLKLRLIDYDGMWVPALANSPSGEAGHQAYQHPARLRDRTYTADVDRFPHLVIGCALRALAVAGRSLWERFDNGDNLLFREADFADPAGSALFRALWDLDDPTVTNLVALLIASAQRPIADTPWLDEVLAGDKAVPVSDAVLAYAADVLGVERRAARTALPVAQIFVVPEEANEFTDFGAGALDPNRRRSRGVGSGVTMLVGGSVVAAAIVVAIVIATSGSPAIKTNDGDPPTAAPPPIDKELAASTPKPGVIETKWTPIAAGQPVAATKALVSGIDTAPAASKMIRSFAHPGAASHGAWFLPDGASALVAGRGGLGVLDLHSKQLRPLPRTSGDHTHVVAALDGTRVVLAGRDKSIRCLDLATGDVTWTQKFDGPIGAVAITPDGQRVVATGEHIGYMEYALENGAELRRHQSLQASRLALAPEGKWALAATESGVELWSLDDARVTTLAANWNATAICVSPDGKQAFAAAGTTIKCWELPDGAALPDRQSPTKGNIVALAITAEGTLVIGSENGEIGLVGIEDSATIPLTPSGPVTAMTITADGQHGIFATDKSGPALCRVDDVVRAFGPSRAGPSAGCLELIRSVTIGPEYMRFAVDARGERVLTATASRLVVYDAARFQRMASFQIKDGRIVAAGFASGQTVVVCVNNEDRFRTCAYDLKDPEPGPRFKLPDADPGMISRIVAVPDRPWVLATTAAAGDVLFETQTGKVVEGWPSSNANDTAVAATSPDGRLIAVASTTNSARLWACDTGAIRRRCEGSAGVVALAFTPDGSKLVGLWSQGRIRVWDPLTGLIVKEVDHEHPGPYSGLAALGDDIIVLGSANGWVLMNLETGRVLNTGNGPDPLVGRGVPAPQRGWVLAVDVDERLSAWRVNAKLAATLPGRPPRENKWPNIALVRDASADPPLGIAFASNGESVVVATQAGKLTRYSADRLHFRQEADAKEAPLSALAQTGERLYSVGRGTAVTVRDAKTLEKTGEIAPASPTGATPSLFVVHPDGSHFLMVTDKLRVVDTKTKRDIAPAAVPKIAMGKKLTQFAYSADGKVGVARWGDAITAVWNPKLTGNARILEELKTASPAATSALGLSPDGRIAILGRGDGRLIAWDTSNGKVLHNEEAYAPFAGADAITAIAFLRAGTHFVTAGRDGRVILWDINGFKKAKEFRGPEGAWQLALSPDGRTLVAVQKGIMERIDLPELPQREQ